MDYQLYEFFTEDERERSWLISMLQDHGFEGFEETDQSLKAYVAAGKVKQITIRELLYDNDLNDVQFKTEELENKNWNEEWEKNFKPVVVADRVGIRAPFHPLLNTEIEIVIEPKMSFGTGHHATTASMVELMLDEVFSGKNILDLGSGTGVLAILAEKLAQAQGSKGGDSIKAAKIRAVDHEEWAYNNCVENIERNHCVLISAVRGDVTDVRAKERFDIILANINRNVILEHLAGWRKLMADDGTLIISGILTADREDIENEGRSNGLFPKKVLQKDGWLGISFNTAK